MPFSPAYDVTPDRRAYTFQAGPVGCLMLHGFMGSPTSSRPMAQYLAEQGITMHCPLLPGHGELPNKLYQIPRQAWIEEAEEALEQLRPECDEVFIAAHSMGCVLGAHLIAQNPDIKGIVMLAPLYKVPNRLLHIMRLLRYVMPWFYPWRISRLRRLTGERVLDIYPDLDLDDPEVEQWVLEATRIPTGAIDEMRKMSDVGRRLWPHLTLPAMIIQGGKDIAVRPGSARTIYESLASEDKAFHLFPHAGHELMRPFEPTHKKVWPLVYSFIQKRSEYELPEHKALV